MSHLKKLWPPSSLLSLLLLAPFILLTQGVSAEIPPGLPPITQYQMEGIPVDNFVKGVILDNNGILYISLTNSGIAAYDGVRWRQVDIPEALQVKMQPWAFAQHPDGRIYVAAVGDFGYLAPNAQGRMRYVSLREQLPLEHQEANGGAWRVHAMGEDIYFNLISILIRWSPRDGTLKLWEAEGDGFRRSFLVQSQLYVWQGGHGLLRMEEEELVLIPGGSRFAEDIIHILLPYDDQRLLVGDASQRFFLYDGLRVQPFKTELDGILTSLSWPGAVLPGGHFALNTLGQGIFVIDRQGKLIQQFDHRTGLMGPSIDTLYLDSQGSLWSLFGLLGNRINRIETASPFTWYDYRLGMGDPPNTSIEHQGVLYIGKGLGFSYWNEAQHRFQEVPDSEGIEDVAFLRQVNGQLLLASYFGVYQLHEGRLIPVLKRAAGSSAISFLHPAARDKNLLFAGAWHWGTNKGIELLRRDNDGFWRAAGKLAGFDEFVHSMVEDDQHRLWISTNKPVVYRLGFPHWPSLESPVIEEFEIAPGLSGNIPFLVSFVDGQLVSTSDHGIFVWDETAQQFQRDRRFGENVAYVVPDLDGRFWVMSKGKRNLRLATPQPDGSYQIEQTLFQPLADKRIHHIRPDAENNLVWFSTYEGLIRYDRSIKSLPSVDFKTLIREVRQGDALLYGGDGSLLNNDQSFTHVENHFQFAYAAPFPGYESRTRYQTRLEGFDTSWSEWQSQASREYTNLPPGHYRFQIKARNVYGQHSDSEVFAFTITPPLWERTWFRGLVVMLVFGLLIEIYRWRVKAIETHNRQLETQVIERTHQFQEAKEQAEVAREEAETASQAKGTFLANMSHELRTPLNGILGYAHILKRRTGSDETLMKGLDIIQHSGHHLITLIDDILDVVKTEAGKLELQPTVFDLARFTQQIINIIAARAEAKGLTLSYDHLSPIPAGVQADEKRLRQVLLNLLGNAIKFTHQGGVSLTLERLAENEIDGEKHSILRFSVDDTGVGIPADQLETVFQPFEQAGDYEQKAEGTGLGLAISQQILQHMGSQLRVDSELGQGSHFWFEVSLPIVDTVESEETSSHTITGYEGKRRKVLVVDDKLYNQLVLVDLLEPLGFDVSTANDGRRAIAKALEVTPDVILTDLMMPVLSGFEAAREMRQQPTLENVVMIAISASVLQTDRDKSRRAGFNDFLPKPVQAQQLFDVLAREMKLTWQYANTTADTEQNSHHEVLLPPRTELEVWYELAQSGRLSAVGAKAKVLVEQDPQYRTFAEPIIQLVAAFEIKEVNLLLKRYLDRT